MLKNVSLWFSILDKGNIRKQCAHDKRWRLVICGVRVGEATYSSSRLLHTPPVEQAQGNQSWRTKWMATKGDEKEHNKLETRANKCAHDNFLYMSRYNKTHLSQKVQSNQSNMVHFTLSKMLSSIPVIKISRSVFIFNLQINIRSLIM